MGAGLFFAFTCWYSAAHQKLSRSRLNFQVDLYACSGPPGPAGARPSQRHVPSRTFIWSSSAAGFGATGPALATTGAGAGGAVWAVAAGAVTAGFVTGGAAAACAAGCAGTGSGATGAAGCATDLDGGPAGAAGAEGATGRGICANARVGAPAISQTARRDLSVAFFIARLLSRGGQAGPHNTSSRQPPSRKSRPRYGRRRLHAQLE